MTSKRQDLTLAEQILYHRLRWSIRLRWFASAFTIVALLVAWYRFYVRFPVLDTAIVAVAVPFYNAIFALFLSNLSAREAITVRWTKILANAQVVCDIIAVVLLVHFTGGVENPFVMFITIPIVYALPMLPQRTVFCHATVAAVLVNLVLWGECFGLLPHVYLPTVAEKLLHQRKLYVFQMSFTTTLTLYLLVFVGGSVASMLRRLSFQLEVTYKQLKELHDARTFYVRKVSHELRAPLSAIRSLLRVLLQGYAGTIDDKATSMLQRVDVRAEGLLELVAELLRFSRLEAAEAPEKPEVVDMHELVVRVARLFQSLAEEKELQLTVSIVPFAVQGTREDLRELVTNLVSNAIRYTPRGGRIGIIGVVHGSYAALNVTDTGIGIPKEKIENVFDEFFRASNARQAVPEGTGMGLAITKRIAEMHDGTIMVRSEEGKGTIFTVTLPVFRREREHA
jgi:signal transduction histidine kinase